MCIFRLELFILLFSYNSFGGAEPNIFGFYNIEWKDYRVCNKSAHSDASTYFDSHKVEHNSASIFVFNLTVMVPVRLDELRIMAYSLKDGRKVLFQNRRIEKLCSLYPAKKLLQLFMHVSNNCVVPKGSFNFKANFDELANTFIGKRFFYGEYFTKTVLISKKKVIACLTIHSRFTKAEENSRKIELDKD